MSGDYYEVIDMGNGTIVASGRDCSEKEGYVTFDGKYYFKIGQQERYIAKSITLNEKWASVQFTNPFDYVVGQDILLDDTKLDVDSGYVAVCDALREFGVEADTDCRIIWIYTTDTQKFSGLVNIVLTKYSDKFRLEPGLKSYAIKGTEREYWVTIRPIAEDKIELIEDLDGFREHIQTITPIYNKPVFATTYFNNVGKKSFQWELWFACNSRCKFCYLGTENRHTEKSRQMKSLKDCLEAIKNLDFDQYNNISLIGGEFFQGQIDDPDVYKAFMEIIRTCFQYYVDKKIGSIWITVTLTLGDQQHLYEVLDLADKMGVRPIEEYGASGLWLCTSWDAEGRFHVPEMEENWDYHMRNIHVKYPWVKFNTTIILMQAFIDRYLAGQWKPKTFMETYHTTVFYKQCGLGQVDFLDFDEGDSESSQIVTNRKAKQAIQKRFGFNFFPTRESFIKFLYKYASEDWDTYDRLFNIEYRADELHRNFNDSDSDILNVRNKHSANESNAAQDQRMNTCGHTLNYAPYIDSDKCCICDRKMIWDTVRGGGL